MAIFNSLGSNYTFENVIEAFAASNKESQTILLKSFLEKRYGGDVVLTYKGRESLRLALQAIGQKGMTVGICGYTCYAVYEAVVREGYEPEYLDIDESLNFSLDTLKKAVHKNPKLKILVVQNTLGYPCDIEKIAAFCKEKKIILIEDLAHAIGATYANGKEAGTVGDFTILSFSQDKMIDGISGGALVIKNKNYHSFLSDPPTGGESKDGLRQAQTKNLDIHIQNRDRSYPFFTFIIRKTYAVVIGKVLHLVLRKRKLLTQPMDNLGTDAIRGLPSWYCQLIYTEFKKIDENLAHRKKIASIYVEHLNKKVVSKPIVDTISLSANLRFPVFVPNRSSLIATLKRSHVYVSDIWYDAPIAPKKYFSKTNYKNGDCPNAERVSERMINLPTHKNVTEKDAKFIAEKINEWLKEISK